MEPFFARARDELGLAEPAEEIWLAYRRRMPELITAAPGCQAALARLRQAGWRSGFVTNDMADNQLGKIRVTGLDGLTDAWCVSGEAGIRNQIPRSFISPPGAADCRTPLAAGSAGLVDRLGGHDWLLVRARFPVQVEVGPAGRVGACRRGHSSTSSACRRAGSARGS